MLRAAPLSREVTTGYSADSAPDSNNRLRTGPSARKGTCHTRICSVPVWVRGSRPRSLEGLARAAQLTQPLSARLGLLDLERKEKGGLLGVGGSGN